MKKTLFVIMIAILSLSSCFLVREDMLVTKKYEMPKTKEYRICGKVGGYTSTQQFTTTSKKRYDKAVVGGIIKVTDEELERR